MECRYFFFFAAVLSRKILVKAGTRTLYQQTLNLKGLISGKKSLVISMRTVSQNYNPLYSLK